MFRRRIALLAGVIVVAGTLIGLALGTGAQSAQAYTTFQWTDGSCFINAWNGGPAVNSYCAQAKNNDFYVGNNGSSYEIVLNNGGSESGECISDWDNSSQDARAGLNPCSGTTPWGANFTEQSCYPLPGIAFHNNHWNNWLNGGDANGDAFYLNTYNKTCYLQDNAY